MPHLEDDIKAEAQRLGFRLAGITLPIPPPHADVYLRWLEEGRQGSMDYLNSERARQTRINPALILPAARSVLVLGMRYPDPRHIPEPAAGQLTGRVASYAWGDDYHDLLPQRMRLLAERMERMIGAELTSKAYTDTGPVLERDFASLAGLGWSGKNTCLISPQQGSYFLLGELFSSAELQPDTAFSTDLCGQCRRCIEACPTACILPDRTIDARRCISYLTIENKGQIPPDMRPLMGNWVFGCDICQMVCPWNIRFSDTAQGMEFVPREEVAQPHLPGDLHLTPQEFNRKFKGSPVQRARRRGYLRNIAVALGNVASLEYIPDLAQVLQNEPEPLPRGHAAWALGRMGTAKARAALEHARKTEPEPVVLEEIRQALETA